MEDIEVAATGPPIRFRRWLGGLVGAAAIAATSLAFLESEAGRQEEEAFVRASRLSLDIFAGIAGSGPRQTFEVGAFRSGLRTSLLATARQLAVLEDEDPGEAAEAVEAVGRAQERAAERVAAAGDQMSRVPEDAPGIDPPLREVLTSDIATLQLDLAEQNRQVDLADRHGTRQERAMFAIALVAIAAVLLGLAGLMGDGRPGRVALVAAAASLVLGMGWAVSGFF